MESDPERLFWITYMKPASVNSTVWFATYRPAAPQASAAIAPVFICFGSTVGIPPGIFIPEKLALRIALDAVLVVAIDRLANRFTVAMGWCFEIERAMDG